MMLTRVAVTLAAVLALAAPALAAAPPRAADLESELVCPTCKTTLDQSDSAIATQMKAYIRARIAAGDSEQQIKDALVAQFGAGVLAKPPAGGFGLLAWLLPLAVLGGGAVAVAVLVRAWSRRRPEPSAPEPLDPALERRVDEELARFDR
jgi:cytochrome c-type biogenesis protein CcmH